VDSLDWLLVMGGPMGVKDRDRFPWMAAERRCIERAVAGGKVVVGVCLGAQLLASVLGARVAPNRHPEIGWFPVALTAAGRRWAPFAHLPDRPLVYHWHGDTFDVPTGAELLAASEACPHQAFRYGSRVLALQFHMEMTLSGARDLVAHCGDAATRGPWVQPAAAMLGEADRFATANRYLDTVLTGLEEATS
jgi:GMP synthase (glutamine-hydrolysing)